MDSNEDALLWIPGLYIFNNRGEKDSAYVEDLRFDGLEQNKRQNEWIRQAHIFIDSVYFQKDITPEI